MENTNEKDAQTPNMSGLFALSVICAYHRVNFDAEQIIHKFSLKDKSITHVDILLIAKFLGFKIRHIKKCKSPIYKIPLPCIVCGQDDHFFIIAKATKTEVLILKQGSQAPSVLKISDFNKLWNKQVILLKHTKAANRDVKFGLAWFMPTIMKYTLQLTEVLISSFTLQIFGLFTPIIMQIVIDKVLVHNSLTTLDVLTVGLIAITLFETIMTIARNYVFTNTTSKMDVILGDRLFKHLVHLPLLYFENRRTGDSIARVRELENIRKFLTGTPLTAVLDLLFVVVYLMVMYFYSQKLTFVVIISLPIFAIISLVCTPAFKKQLDEKYATGAESQSYLVESVTGMNTVKALALEPQMQKKWGELLANYTKASYKTSILAGNMNAAANLVQKVFDIIILWEGARLVISGDITVGQMIAFRMLAGRVSTPILRIVQLWQEFQQVKISMERVGDIFAVKPEMDMNQTKTRLPQIAGSIEFQNVSFRYRPGTAEAIKNMSFRIPAGKTIGIVGRSGSGKSTISKLVQRLYIPESGKIIVDGIDTAITDTDWLRRQIGVVLQENFLFHMTIKENICINNPSTSIEKIIEICKISGAHEFITKMPEAYDTVLGENGTGLSGGQKQRLAIARALMDDPRILIFDEATSALDYESERIINANLADICKGRTVLIIAHRLSMMKVCDAIMVINEGNLVEYGTQEQLLGKKGLYHYLYHQQFSA